MIDVSVVIPTRNRRVFLEEAVASVLSQQGVSLQLLVIDDASTDDTKGWLMTVGDDRLSSIRLARHAERSAARNRGLRESEGEFVVFLDDDDRLRPGALRVLVAAARENPAALAAVGARVEFDDRDHRRRAAHVRRTQVVNLWPVILCGWGALPGQGHTLLRRLPLIELGGWREDVVNVEDMEIWLRLSRAGSAVFVPDDVLEYRMHAGQWRPFDAHCVEDELLSAFIDGLDAAERRGAKRYLRARVSLLAGGVAFTAGSCRPALRAYLRAATTAPRLLTSVVTRRNLSARLMKSAIGSVIGSGAIGQARRGTKVIREMRRRNPGDGRTVPVVDESARR